MSDRPAAQRPVNSRPDGGSSRPRPGRLVVSRPDRGLMVLVELIRQAGPVLLGQRFTLIFAAAEAYEPGDW